MKRIIVILLSLLMIGCISSAKQLVVKKQIVPIDPVAAPRIIEDKEVSIKVKVKSNEKSLERAVSDLNNIYGAPSVEINALRDEDGKIIIMKKLYYKIDEKVFTIVSIVNDIIILIDTVHAPIRINKKENKK